MAFPTPVNDQITDAVSQSGVTVLGDASAMALATLYQANSHSLGVLMQNSVQQQQLAASLANAVVSTCIGRLVKA